jgi:hypothetical protein
MAQELFAALTAPISSVTTLVSAAASGDATISVANAPPTVLQTTPGQFRIKVGDELMLVTSPGGGTVWPVDRGIEGTRAASHASGEPVFVVLTSGAMGNVTPAVHGTSHQSGGADRLRPSDLGEFFDVLRSSEVGTMPRLLAQSAVTLTSGTTYGSVAFARTAGRFTKIRFATGGAGSGVTDLRAGVWNASGTKLTETADLSGSFATNTLFDNQALGGTVTVAEGDQIFLGIGSVASTAISVRGAAALGVVLAVSPALGRAASGLTAGAVLPNLTGSAGGLAPWVELIP